MKNHLLFIQDSKYNGRTEVWQIYSSHSEELLGQIKWYSPWRCYVLDTEPDCVWSHECLSEVIIKIISLEDKRKEQNKQ